MHSSAVVIKACALKEGQSIQPSASTSHQASAKNDSPGPGGLLAPPRASERATGGCGSGVCNNCSDDRTVLKVRAAVELAGTAFASCREGRAHCCRTRMHRSALVMSW